MALGMMLAVMGGMLVCVQNTFNANVKQRVGAWATTTLVLALGFLASLFIGLISEGGGLFDLRDMETWYWFSGIIGVGVVMSVTQSVQQLGPSYAISIVMVSQILFALLWDTLGWFGLEAIPFTWKTALGIVLIVGGVLLFQLSGKKVVARQQVKQVG
ncbi:DMT family transporter [Exiguobacterium sp. SH5S13]|uniref:DMT family transporter n=1 Tax=unclassified Exiguobacterium TaxID=2644629 RepID=UPI00103B93C9|nr:MULTISPECIES: DMT family transporter [unclassified Exiguobacterium]TCI25407.1 DMT family transporter [Exiguobacterium sp. SH5S4]TCI56185.1 DMT family transporter [Exiguobacterium sp. SH5S13]